MASFNHNIVPQNQRQHQHTEVHLPYRRWSHSTFNGNFQQDHIQYFKLHLVCYNILAQSALESNEYLYTNCSTNNLKWYRRRDRLLRELLWQDADILCLQEMEEYHYQTDFRPRFLANGYESIYIRRTGDKSDGCCLFYKTDRLRLVQSRAISFYRPDISLLNKDQCGLIALFQPTTKRASSDDMFCVATTHLIYSPERGDIKLAQLQYLLAEINNLATKNRQTDSCYPIILCGDFNAYPHSPLVQFVLNQYIKYDMYRRIDISGQTSAAKSSTKFSHQLPFGELLPSSFVTGDCRLGPLNGGVDRPNSQPPSILTHSNVFQSVYDLNDTRNVTVNVENQPGVVDYIFYTYATNNSSKLHLLSRFDLYQQNQMIDVHMPNHQFGSDHFLLGAKFALKLKGN